MYIGLKNIQRLLTDAGYPVTLTSSDETHALTGWYKLTDAPEPLNMHTLYACRYGE